MRKGKPLSADDIMLTCGLENGRRVLRVCRPRGGPSLAPPQIRAMLLAFDSSGLCHPERETVKVLRTNRNCKKRLDLVVVPLREEIPDREATTVGRRVIIALFECYKLEGARTTKADSKDMPPVPVRVHAASRQVHPSGVAV